MHVLVCSFGFQTILLTVCSILVSKFDCDAHEVIFMKAFHTMKRSFIV